MERGKEMNVLNKIEFSNGVVAYYFNDDVSNHILSTNPLVFSLSYDKYVTIKSNYTYEQWLSIIKKPNPITINAIGVRESILRFAVAMEEEMRKKDKKYSDEDRTNFDFLVDHLKEEREEVDHELILYTTLSDKSFSDYDTKVELVHEAIMCMLVHDVVK